MILKNSFYKKSIFIIVFVFVVFICILLFAMLIYVDANDDRNIDLEFISYERYIKNYFSEIESDIASAANSSDLKQFVVNKNNKDVQLFLDYYLKKENAPKSIYIFDEDNNCILNVGVDDKKEEAVKFIADRSVSGDVYISDFFVDKYNNENYILFGKNVYTYNSEIKLVFCYSNENFEKFNIKDNEIRFFSVLIPNGDFFADYSEYISDNEFISNMDFIELSKIIKLKVSKGDYVNNSIESLIMNGTNNDILVYYKAISEPNMILISLEKDKKLFFNFTIWIVGISLLFILTVVTLYSKAASVLFSRINKSKDEIKDTHLTINQIDFTKTEIEAIDLYINKISELCGQYKKFLNNIKNMSSMFNMNIGIFEILAKDGIVIYSSEISELFGIKSNSKRGKIDKISIEEFFKFKNANWNLFEEEEDVYCIEFGNIKKWIKVFYYDENKTKGIIAYVSNYIINKYKNLFDADFDHITGFLKKETFIEKVDEYIKNNKLGFGCFVSLELSYYSTLYDSYGEYVADEYLRIAISHFSSFFIGFFAGIKHKGEFMAFIYSENSKEDIKSKFQVWENKISSSIFVAPDGKNFKIKFVAGYACYPADANDTDTLMKYSVFALYETKKLYKETVHPFSVENYNRDMFFEIRTKALDKLIDENTAVYHFQPIININDCSVYGYEALLRTKDDIFSNPIDIINLALTEGKAYLVEKMNVLNCMEILKNNRSDFDNKRLFINSIATNTLTEEDLRNIRTNYIDVKHLIVYELSTMFADNLTVINKCEVFNRIGAKFAIDRFGGKHTDDFSLLNGNPEFIKIDRNLILDIHLKKEKQSHIVKVVKYAKENNINVIAVGIETYDELLTVIKLGIEFVQGYYIAMPKDTLVPQIRENLKKEINEIKEKSGYGKI